MADRPSVFLRTQFNYDMESASLESGLSMEYVDPETGEYTVDKGLTQQEFAEAADINEIVRRFGLTGELPPNPRIPQSGDFVGIDDYHSALRAVREAQEAFMEMPAELRARFGNDPAMLMDFLDDDKNRDEAIKLGLVPAKAEPQRDVVTAVDELAAKLTTPPKQS